MGDSASEGEGSQADDGSSACLDEWGWDPSVDAFLEEVVSEAPRLPNGLVDFAWVACTFFETLAPDEDQVAAALERFSPAALQERFLYLRSGRSTPRPDGPGREAARSSSAPGVGSAAPACDADAGGGVCDGGVPAPFEEDEAERAPSSPSLRPAGAVPPGRDRVLDAMQSFLFGRPTPQALPPPGAAEAACPGGGGGAAETPVLEGRWEEAADLAAPPLAAAAPAATSSLVPLLAAALPAAAGAESAGCDAESCSNEALRCCLEELRWHGEALRRCAAGAEAAELAAEAATRRKALLRRLGFGPRPSSVEPWAG